MQIWTAPASPPQKKKKTKKNIQNYATNDRRQLLKEDNYQQLYRALGEPTTLWRSVVDAPVM
jgi:hypothetical protein